MKTFFKISVLCLLLPVLVTSCRDYGPVEIGNDLTSLRLTLLSEPGSPESPLKLSADGVEISLKVEAVDASGQTVEDFTGKLTFRTSHGFLGRNGWVEEKVSSGDTVSFTLARGVGQLRIMAEDKETMIVGASDPIYLPEPTLATIQTPVGDIDASPWREHFMRIKTGTIVVTHVAGDGFYATDVDGTSYNHVYVYTHGNPECDRGDVLHFLAGTVSEFFGLTELSFPDYMVRCNFHQLPPAVALTGAMLSDEVQMEMLEAALVSVSDLKVYQVNEFDYYSYGQWIGKSSEGYMITVATSGVLPGFDPRAFSQSGGQFSKLVGILRQHYAADPEWILVPRNECDAWGLGERPEYCDQNPPISNCDEADDE